MSLDVSLIRKYHISYDGGKTLIEQKECVYENNITHNLTEMADKAKIYNALWHPENLELENPVKAEDIIPLLEKGLKDLEDRPEYFEKFNSPNGWGLYEHFVPFVRNYLKACKEFPQALVEVDR
jgi:hypothetical protein